MPEKIMLWGPSSSGKTMLIWGLARDIDQYSKYDEEFRYTLHQVFQPNPHEEPRKVPVMDIIHQRSQFPDGSQGIESSEMEFQRIAKPNNGLNDKQIKRHNFIHQIFLNDIEGKFSTTFIDDDSQLQVQQAYAHSRNIVSLFDITFGSDHDSEKVISDFRRFITFLTENHTFGKKKRNLAICLTKIDKYVLAPLSNPWEILSMVYGSEVKEYLLQEKQVNRKINFELFATSAVGVLYNPDKYKNEPNINDHGDYFINNGTSWHPIHAAMPFFWIFDIIEKEIFEENHIKRSDHISYPLSFGNEID